MAGIPMAIMHTFTKKNTVNRFMCGLFPSSFCILIFFSLEVSYGRQRESNCDNSRRRDSHTNDRHPDGLDDSGPPKDEDENGKKPVSGVTKAPGEWMKLRCAVQVGLRCR
jgi:hypothetical protein